MHKSIAHYMVDGFLGEMAVQKVKQVFPGSLWNGMVNYEICILTDHRKLAM